MSLERDVVRRLLTLYLFGVDLTKQSANERE